METQTLSEKHCVPCEGGTPPLTPEEISEYRKEIQPEWEMLDNKKIRREFRLKNFVKAMAFVDAAADIAESEDHHPDIHIHYNRVVLELWTHAIGGLSENDFIVAAKIDEISRIGQI